MNSNCHYTFTFILSVCATEEVVLMVFLHEVRKCLKYCSSKAFPPISTSLKSENLGRKGFISSYSSQVLPLPWEKTKIGPWERNMEAGPEAEAKEECCLLACPGCTPESLSQGCHHQEWFGSFHIKDYLRKWTTGLHIGQPYVGYFSIKTPLSI